MFVSQLNLFPVKAMQPVLVDHAVCEVRGFRGDRRFMVVDDTGKFLTQRHDPLLGTITAHVTPNGLTLSVADHAHLAVAFPDLTSPIEVTVWDDTVKAHPIPIADAWLRDVLKRPARLVYMADDCARENGMGASVSFADGHPYLFTNTASLADLNARIPNDTITMNAFRSNIVFESDIPWIEDTWKRVGIGDAVFELVSPCVRCKVTTLDPADPLIVNPNQEPLRTLADFRRDDQRGGVTFGWNAMCLTPNVVIQIGDKLSVIS